MTSASRADSIRNFLPKFKLRSVFNRFDLSIEVFYPIRVLINQCSITMLCQNLFNLVHSWHNLQHRPRVTAGKVCIVLIPDLTPPSVVRLCEGDGTDWLQASMRNRDAVTPWRRGPWLIWVPKFGFRRWTNNFRNYYKFYFKMINWFLSLTAWGRHFLAAGLTWAGLAGLAGSRPHAGHLNPPDFRIPCYFWSLNLLVLRI